MIHQLNLYGKDKVEIAIERIRGFEPEDGYWLAPNIPRSMLREKLREHLPEEVVDIITEDKGGHHG